jgi:thiosulfate/3-mercaptopyruvate sulfurtransferase
MMELSSQDEPGADIMDSQVLPRPSEDKPISEVLVSTSWLNDQLDNPAVRIVDAVEDSLIYEQRHIPGAVKLDWHTELQDDLWRDLIDRARFEALASRLGIGRDTTVVFYGDEHNWNACLAYWVFRSFGHTDCRVLNGGRACWEAEGRPLTRDIPEIAATSYTARDPDSSLCASRDDVLRAIERGTSVLLDVRSKGEYRGDLVLPLGFAQVGAQRMGHIPGAVNIPWEKTIRADETFRSADELQSLFTDQGVLPDREVIVYCWIGERSSHTWFVLSELLGYPRVRNYDGGWAEWGNLMGVPIERAAS